MTDQLNTAAAEHSKARKQTDELLHLRPIVLVAREHVRSRGDANHPRLDVAGSLQQPLIDCCRLDSSGAVDCRQYSILPSERHEVQAALDSVAPRCAVMLEDGV